MRYTIHFCHKIKTACPSKNTTATSKHGSEGINVKTLCLEQKYIECLTKYIEILVKPGPVMKFL